MKNYKVSQLKQKKISGGYGPGGGYGMGGGGGGGGCPNGECRGKK